MDLRAYLDALHKSWLVIVGLALIGAAGAYLAFTLAVPQYANVVVFYVSTPIGENENAQSAGQFAQNRVTSYVELLQSDRLAQDVAKDTGLPTDVVSGTIGATARGEHRAGHRYRHRHLCGPGGQDRRRCRHGLPGSGGRVGQRRPRVRRGQG